MNSNNIKDTNTNNEETTATKPVAKDTGKEELRPARPTRASRATRTQQNQQQPQQTTPKDHERTEYVYQDGFMDALNIVYSYAIKGTEFRDSIKGAYEVLDEYAEKYAREREE